MSPVSIITTIWKYNMEPPWCGSILYKEEMMRKGYELVLGAKAIAAPMRPIPEDFTIVTTRKTDPVTENDLIEWRDDFLVGGHWTEIGYGFVVTRECKKLSDVEDKVASARQMIRVFAWQEHEFVRLGCYSWLKIDEEVAKANEAWHKAKALDASDVA